LIHVKAQYFSRRHDDTKRRIAMPLTDALTIAAIVAAFVVFGGVLAWAEYQTRNLPRPVARRDGPAEKKNEPATIHAKAA
jgi:hypothetical protein